MNAPMVVFHGPNGQGKTNALEALGVLGSLRSFRTARLAEAAPTGTSGLDVRAVVNSEDQTRTFSFRVAEGRRLSREDRPVDAVSWLTSLRASWFSPADVGVVRDEPQARRALLDRTLVTLQPSYLGLARDFRRVLDQKAALYRSGRASEAELDVLDVQLAELGARVTSARLAAVARIAVPFSRLYAEIAGGELATTALRSTLGEGDTGALKQRFEALLGSARASERQRRRVLVGPQRDDVLFEVGGKPARTTASQGQARSVILAWKLAEILTAGESGDVPIFLVDDLGSELDAGRTAAFVARLRDLGAQVFVSTTDPRVLQDSGDQLRVRVSAGELHPE